MCKQFCFLVLLVATSTVALDEGLTDSIKNNQDIPCKDLLQKCPTFAANGFCNNTEIMSNCKMSCGGCYKQNGNDVVSTENITLYETTGNVTSAENITIDEATGEGNESTGNPELDITQDHIGLDDFDIFENESELTMEEAFEAERTDGDAIEPASAQASIALMGSILDIIDTALQATNVIIAYTSYDTKGDENGSTVPPEVNTTSDDIVMDDIVIFKQEDIFENGESGVGGVCLSVAMVFATLIVALQISTCFLLQ